MISTVAADMYRVVAAVLLLLIFCCSASDPFLPNSTPTPLLVKTGSYLLSPQQTLSAVNASNTRVYGLVAVLNYNNVPVWWVIQPGKPKDGIDIVANVTTLYPTLLSSVQQISFSSGLFVVPFQYAAQALPLIAGFETTQAPPGIGNSNTPPITVYVLAQETWMNVRLSLSSTIAVGILQDANPCIHQTFLLNAGFAPYLHFQTVSPTAQNSSGNGLLSLCSTIFTTSNYDDAAPSGYAAVNIKQCLQRGVNFFAQGGAVGGYENSAGDGIQAVPGSDGQNSMIPVNYANDTICYRYVDIPSMQFLGGIDPYVTGGIPATAGGSVGWLNWNLNLVAGSPSVFAANASYGLIEVAIQNSGIYYASIGKLSSLSGGLATYVGGYDFTEAAASSSSMPAACGQNINNFTPEQTNMIRLFLNAVLLPGVSACSGYTLDGMLTAVDDAFTLVENTPTSLDILRNDFDALYYWNASYLYVFMPPLFGVTAILSNATILFTPNNNYFGQDSFSYAICNQAGACASATISVTVLHESQPPVAVADIVTTEENQPVNISVLLNDSDPDGDLNPLSLQIISGPSSGVATVLTSAAVITYTPNQNFNGVDLLYYQVCDAASNCASTSLAVNVTFVNQAPIATDWLLSISETIQTGSGSGGLVSYSMQIYKLVTDPENQLNPTNLSIVTQPTLGTANYSVASGLLTYTPLSNVCGNDTFVYDICDLSLSCTYGSVYITIACNTSVPMPALNATAGTTNENTPLLITADLLFGPGYLGSTLQILDAPSNGVAYVVSPLGMINYIPNYFFNGTDSFVYSVCSQFNESDCNTGTYSIKVNCTGLAPVAVNNAMVTLIDTTVTGNVIYNDLIDGAGLSSCSATNGTHGNTSMEIANQCTVSYTPIANFTGSDSFNYTICVNGHCSSATVTVLVLSVMQGEEEEHQHRFRLAATQYATVPQRLSTEIALLQNDLQTYNVSLIESYNITLLSLPVNGIAERSPWLHEQGVVIYHLYDNSSTVNSDTFNVSVCIQFVNTSYEDVCSESTVQISIITMPQNPGVNISQELYTLAENTALTFQPTIHDNSPIGLSPLTIVTSTVHGLLSVVEGALDGMLDRSRACNVTYTPDADYYGLDSFTYYVTDTYGMAAYGSVTFNVTMVPASPSCSSCHLSVLEYGSVLIDPDSSCTDPNNRFVASNSSVTVKVAPGSGVATVQQNGFISYRPAAGFVGNDTLVFAICNLDMLCANVTTAITVTPNYRAPVGVADTVNITGNSTSAVQIAVLNNDISYNGNIGLPTVACLPSAGVAIASGANISYYPAANYFGTVTFCYIVCGSIVPLCSGQTNVTVTISAVPVPPTIVADSYTTISSIPVTMNVLANDVFPLYPVNASSIRISQNATRGTLVSGSSAGIYTYTPNVTLNGSSTPVADSFVYRICDAAGNCGSATVTLTIYGSWSAPVTVSDSVTVHATGCTTIRPLSNDYDPDGDLASSTFFMLTPPLAGTLTQYSSNNLSFCAPAMGSQNISIQYQICDATALCSTGTISIVILASPIANPDQGIALIGKPSLFNVLANDVAAAGFNYSSLSIVSGPSNGTASALSTGGNINYTSATTGVVSGSSDSLVYRICDVSRYCAQSTLTVTLIANYPLMYTDNITVDAGDAISINVTSNDVDIYPFIQSTLTLLTKPTLGTASVSAGLVHYSCNSSVQGLDTFTYKVCDTSYSCGNATVAITILNVPPSVHMGLIVPPNGSSYIDLFSGLPSGINTKYVGIQSYPTFGTVNIVQAAAADRRRSGGSNPQEIYYVTTVTTTNPNISQLIIDELEVELCYTTGQCSNSTVTILVSNTTGNYSGSAVVTPFVSCQQALVNGTCVAYFGYTSNATTYLGYDTTGFCLSPPCTTFYTLTSVSPTNFLYTPVVPAFFFTGTYVNVFSVAAPCSTLNSSSRSGNYNIEFEILGTCGGNLYSRGVYAFYSDFANGTCNFGCDGIPNSGTVVDACGVCGGNNSTCSITTCTTVWELPGLAPKTVNELFADDKAAVTMAVVIPVIFVGIVALTFMLIIRGSTVRQTASSGKAKQRDVAAVLKKQQQQVENRRGKTGRRTLNSGSDEIYPLVGGAFDESV